MGYPNPFAVPRVLLLHLNRETLSRTLVGKLPALDGGNANGDGVGDGADDDVADGNNDEKMVKVKGENEVSKRYSSTLSVCPAPSTRRGRSVALTPTSAAQRQDP